MSQPEKNTASYYVDEADDGVLFGKKGHVRIHDPDSSRFFILGMIRCENDTEIVEGIQELRKVILSNPLFAGIPSAQIEAGKTAKFFMPKMTTQKFEQKYSNGSPQQISSYMQ